jgi:hypothetical protein
MVQNPAEEADTFSASQEIPPPSFLGNPKVHYRIKNNQFNVAP